MLPGFRWPAASRTRASETILRHPLGDPRRAEVLPISGSLARVLFATTGLLFLTGVATRCAVHLWGRNLVFGLVPLFELDREANVPTWFQSSVLLLAGLFAMQVALRLQASGTRLGRLDLLACALPIYISLDEVAQLHERFDLRLGEGALAERAFYYTWLATAVALLPLVAWAMRSFLRRLPAGAARAARLGCGLYLAGAVGMEMVGGLVAIGLGHDNLTYALLTCVEEGLEMAGMCQFAVAMLLALESLSTVRRFEAPSLGATEELADTRQIS